MIKNIVLSLFLFFSHCAFAAEADLTEPNLNLAFKNYQSGDFDSSKSHIDQALQTQPHNCYLIYNLGLVEYKRGKVGMALALWRKALSINPNIAEARKALNFAIAQMPIKPLAPNVESSMDWIEKIITDHISINILWPLLLVAMALFFKLMFQFLSARRRAFIEDQPTPMFPSKLILYAVFFVALAVIAGMNIADKVQTKATVVASAVQAKTGPSDEDATLFDLPEGTELLVYEKNGTWYKVEDPSGREGWVNANLVYVTSEKIL